MRGTTTARENRHQARHEETMTALAQQDESLRVVGEALRQPGAVLKPPGETLGRQNDALGQHGAALGQQNEPLGPQNASMQQQGDALHVLIARTAPRSSYIPSWPPALPEYHPRRGPTTQWASHVWEGC